MCSTAPGACAAATPPAGPYAAPRLSSALGHLNPETAGSHLTHASEMLRFELRKGPGRRAAVSTRSTSGRRPHAAGCSVGERGRPTVTCQRRVCCVCITCVYESLLYRAIGHSDRCGDHDENEFLDRPLGWCRALRSCSSGALASESFGYVHPCSRARGSTSWGPPRAALQRVI